MTFLQLTYVLTWFLYSSSSIIFNDEMKSKDERWIEKKIQIFEKFFDGNEFAIDR